MATENICIEDGRIKVERAGSKPNVDVAASDVDSVSFTRAGGDESGDGALVLHTSDGDVVIRVANSDAGEALSIVYEACADTRATEQAVGPALQNGEPVGAPANESENAPIEQDDSPSGARREENN
jgi:hypothetical protein